MSTDEPLRISTDGLHSTAGPRLDLRIDHAVYDPHDKDPARRFKATLLNEGFAVSPDGVQIYNMGVFHYEGLYIGLPLICHHTGKVPPGWPGFEKLRLSPAMKDAVSKYGDYTGFYNIQLVTSRDLVHWQRVAERQPFLEASPLGAGACDIQTINGPSAPV